jgi:hypothetical protein
MIAANRPLAKELAQYPGWKVVYADELAILFAKDN